MNRKYKKHKFRSNFEAAVAETLEGFEYEPFTVPYVMHRKYCPDFVHSASGTLVECKGFFREGDTKKYTSVRDSLPEGQTLVFVLMNPTKKVRKGSKITMAACCTKQNIKWYSLNTIEELVKDVTNT